MLLLDVTEWMNYLGHFHPVVVHLPIGILFIAFFLELLSWKKNDGTLNTAIQLCLLISFVTAVASCLFGWFLAADGAYEETTLNLHRWMGIAVALIAGICWLLKRRQKMANNSANGYKSLLIILMLLLFATGHFGGSMTHGEDYLSLSAIAQTEKADTSKHTKKIIANLQEAIIYSDLVQPILDEKCSGCHSKKKIKGGLRMDDETLLFKGGKHGVVIKPGNPDESELIVRILLPKDDDKRMPPKDKKAITKEETEILRWWIKNGADTHKKVKDIPADAAIKPILASFAAPAKDTVVIAPLSKVYDKKIAPASKEDIKALTSLGILVEPVAKNNNLLEISCINYPAFDNSKLALLAKIADNIVSLKLDRTAITDEALGQIAQFKKLVKLNLAETNITTAGLAKLQTLPSLEVINVVGTKANDGALQFLSAIKSLKHIYCWNSLITKKGVDDFKQKKYAAIVDNGDASK